MQRMPGEQPYLPQPGVSEQAIVEEMLRNREAGHWKKCNEFVTRQVHLKAKNFSWSSQEEIIQEVMYRIARYLPNFRFECALKTWLFQIIGRCIVDEHRYLQHKERLQIPLVDTFTEADYEGEELKTIAANFISIEESFEISEKMRNVVTALLEYASTHANSMRNLQIVRMVILEGHTQAEAAKKLGCDVGVVSYVVREAKSYAKKTEHKS
jgi:RNA polymerase sigma factor (sigma-70 family)